MEFENALNQVIRPSTRVRITEFNETMFDEGNVTCNESVFDTELIGGAINLSPLRNKTHYATFANYGYSVPVKDNENLRCVPDDYDVYSDIMPITKFAGDGSSRGLAYTITGISEPNTEIAISVFPYDLGLVKLTVKGYNGAGELVETITKNVVDFNTFITLPVVCDKWEIYYGTFATHMRLSIYPPILSDNLDEKVLFDSTTITNISYQKYTDFYTQDNFSYVFEVTALDLEGNFDPSNQKGKYNNFTELYKVNVYIGTEIKKNVVEYPYRKIMYLVERPTYKDSKVTFKFGLLPFATSIYNNNLLPPIVGNKETGSRNGNILNIMKDVYVLPPNFNRTLVPKTVLSKVGYSNNSFRTDGYSTSNTNSDIYKLLTNATGRYFAEGYDSSDTQGTFKKYGYSVFDFNDQLKRYFNGSLNPVKHITARDILSFQAEILPQLKTLTIKKFENNDSNATLRTYDRVELNRSAFVNSGGGKSTARIGLVNTEEIVLSSCKVSEMTGATLTGYTVSDDYNYLSGITHPIIIVEVDTNSLTDTVVFKLDLYGLDQRIYDISYSINDTGEDMVVNNPYITSDVLVEIAKKTITAIANCREQYTLTIAHDIRLQIGDIITIDTEYENNIPCIISSLKYTFPSIKSELVCRRLTNVANT